MPDLVEWPSVVPGIFAAEFLSLPEEVLTTTMIHHQHYFPIVDDHGKLKPAFLAVTNVEVERPELISRNAERVLTARLRDAQFFWNADRKMPLEARLGRLDTILFHKKLGSYRQKAERLETLAAWVAREALGSRRRRRQRRDGGAAGEGGSRRPTWCASSPSCRARWAASTRARRSSPKRCGRRFTTTTCRPPSKRTRRRRGRSLAVRRPSWAAVSIADKLDTLVGLFAAGERPTGSRDPFGLRRQAHGLFKVLVDLPDLTGLSARPTIGALVDAAAAAFESSSTPLDEAGRAALFAFLAERLAYVLEQRGFDVRNVRAVLAGRPLAAISPLEAKRMLEVLPEYTGTPEFQQLATAFKRVKNIAKELTEAQIRRCRTAGPGARRAPHRAGRAGPPRRARAPAAGHRARAGIRRKLSAGLRRGCRVRSIRGPILFRCVRDGG